MVQKQIIICTIPGHKTHFIHKILAHQSALLSLQHSWKLISPVPYAKLTLICLAFRTSYLYWYSYKERMKVDNKYITWINSYIQMYKKYYLKKRCWNPIKLHNLLSFHKIRNITIRISSSSPHPSALQEMQLLSSRVARQYKASSMCHFEREYSKTSFTVQVCR